MLWICSEKKVFLSNLLPTPSIFLDRVSFRVIKFFEAILKLDFFCSKKVCKNLICWGFVLRNYFRFRNLKDFSFNYVFSEMRSEIWIAVVKKSDSMFSKIFSSKFRHFFAINSEMIFFFCLQNFRFQRIYSSWNFQFSVFSG